MDLTSTRFAHIMIVEPEEGRETQFLYWFRVCVAEWHNGVSPRSGVTHEEILIWDKGRKCHVLESHRYGRESTHSCERSALDADQLYAWILKRSPEILWRHDAVDFYPPFVQTTDRVASNDSPARFLA